MTEDKTKDLEVEEQNDDEWDMDEEDHIVLTLDDDTELECVVLDIFPFHDKEYIALFPVSEEDEDEEEEGILLYEYAESEDGEEIELSQIESEEDYNAVAEEFDRLLAEDDECDGEGDCDCGHDHSRAEK